MPRPGAIPAAVFHFARATNAGFEFNCRPGSTDKPLVLQVGRTGP